MRSSLKDVMPLKIRRALRKLGADISTARRKRRLTIDMMCERAGISKQTYQRIEAGDPSVSCGAYAMCLFVLGLGDAMGELADPHRDESGLLMDQERLPSRVRSSRAAEEGL